MDQLTKDLETAVLTAAHDDPVFAVWADTLLERGDPRGELIALSQRLQVDPSDTTVAEELRQLVSKHADAWCPGCLDEAIDVTWQHGFIDTLSYCPTDFFDDSNYGYEGDDDRTEDSSGAAVRHLLAHPMTARLRSISSDCPLAAEGNHGCWGNHEGFLDALLSTERPHLRSLELDATALPIGLNHGASTPQLSFLRTGCMHEADISLGDLSTLWRVAPRLEHLVLSQPEHGAELGEIAAPRLRTLVFGSDDDNNLTQISRGSLPALQTLLLRVSNGRQVERVLDSASLGQFKNLGLIMSLDLEEREEQGDRIIEALLRSPRAPALHTLDLGGLTASDEAWYKLAAGADRFSALTELRLTSWNINPDEELDDWLDEIPEMLTPQMSPHTRPVGEHLTKKLPVRWLLARIVPYGSNEADNEHPGMFMDTEQFAEHRSGAQQINRRA